MSQCIERRDFIRLTTAGTMLCLTPSGLLAYGVNRVGPKIISPGCRRSKVRVAKLYMGTSHGLWPKPDMNFDSEIRFYESQFKNLSEELSDVEFVCNNLVTSAEEVNSIKNELHDVDGILAIHFNIGIRPILEEILSAGQPTMVFAIPYSGHEWVGFGALQKETLGAKMECILSSDYNQLAAAIRPFRAIHHLREAKILNLTTRDFKDYASSVGQKFGTEIKQIQLQQVVDAYHSISNEAAKLEAERWIQGAIQVVEPSEEEIIKSCKLALAFEKLLDEEDATVITADCYGSMHGSLCQTYAYPCIGFTRLNDIGLGGICESDLRSAMTHVLFQG